MISHWNPSLFRYIFPKNPRTAVPSPSSGLSQVSHISVFSMFMVTQTTEYRCQNTDRRRRTTGQQYGIAPCFP